MKSFIFVLVLFIIPSCTSTYLNKELGSACNITKECAPAYSICDDSKKCVCAKGFKSKDANCEPQKLSCPTWDGVQDPKPGQACQLRYNYTTKEDIHNCSDHEICFLYPKVFTTHPLLNAVNVGHCCPKPPQNTTGLNVPCPFSVSNPGNGLCAHETVKGIVIDMGEYVGDYSGRPLPVHNCSISSNACVGVHDKFACCPSPCQGSPYSYVVGKRCYECETC